MSKGKHSEAQMIGALKQLGRGVVPRTWQESRA